MDQQSNLDHLNQVTKLMQDYIRSVKTRRVAPTPEQVAALEIFDKDLSAEGMPTSELLHQMHQYGSPATVATTGGRYYGFVIGGVLPAALGAYCLSGAWDQCAGLHVLSPTAEKLEMVAGKWLKQLLDLPQEAGTGFVTGATMANFTGLAAARHALLKKLDWNVETQGLYGAPEIKVIVGDDVHVSVLKALSLLGFGSERVVRIPIDDQGRMMASEFDLTQEPTIVCLQAGNVDSGGIDPMMDIIPKAKARGAWVHIDGAFGLWARAVPELQQMIKGVELADSWAVDLHKWLNVPYDSGVVICKDPEHLRASMSVNAAYLPPPGAQGPYQYTPGMSRRARGIEAYAALCSLGVNGVQNLISESCRLARKFAALLQEAGFEILNDVVLNQVLVDLGPETDEIMKYLQQEGTCWVAGTTWGGRKAMRISVSSWTTTDDDVERSAAAMVEAAQLCT